jgi:SAM-dependent methyltransferase
MIDRVYSRLKKVMVLRELRGTLHVIRSRIRYLAKPGNLGAEEAATSDPKSSYRSFYIEVEKEKMRRLRKLRGDGIAKNVVDARVADASGQRWLEFLVDRGLKRTDRVLEYGCGSLRLGKSVIEFLESGHYVGLDITDFFYLAGIENYLGQALLEARKPRFGVIGSEEHERIRRDFKFDVGFSTLALMHVPPAEMDEYFRNVLGLMHADSVFYFDFQPSLFALKKNSLTWGVPFRLVRRAVDRSGGNLTHVHGNLFKLTVA